MSNLLSRLLLLRTGLVPIPVFALAFALVFALPAHAIEADAGAPPGVQIALLSDDDQTLYQRAFKAVEANDWVRARLLSRRADDPLLAKAIQWLDLRRPGTTARFPEIAAFIDANPDWPEQTVLRRRAEEAMNDSIADETIIAWLGAHPPLTTAGMVRLGEAYLRTGAANLGADITRRAWIEGNFGHREERYFLARHRKLLQPQDHEARLDRLLWDNQRRAALRQMAHVPSGLRAAAEARLRLRAFSGNVDWAVRQVPAELVTSPGLVYERLRWRRQKGMDEAALELLNPAPQSLVRPEIWWTERSILARRALASGEISRAYNLTLDHRLTEGADFAEANWLAGWIALRFLGDNAIAYRHFVTMYDGVRYPVSQSRGAYWAGRSAEAMGNADLARQWFITAARHVTTYYGQLAADRLTLGDRPELPAQPTLSPALIDRFEKQEMTRLVTQLAALDERDHLRPFVTHMALLAKTPEEYTLVIDMAHRIGRPELAVAAARRSAQDGVRFLPQAYPRPALFEGRHDDTPLILSVTRQESGFDVGAVSPAGALGLMQLMPATARNVARQMGVPYSPHRLNTDGSYNASLGVSYLNRLLSRYNGSYVLTLAAYNGGPSNVRNWIKAFGDPRQADVDVIDWIEMIPFDETRNYVQRVMEGLQIYRLLASGGDRLAMSPGEDLNRRDLVP